MEPGRSDVARRAFDAVAAARTATSIEELDRVLGDRLADLGFDHYVGLNLVDPGGALNHQVLFGRSPEAWAAHYADRDFAASDPVVRAMTRSLDPLYWSDVTAVRPLEAHELRVFDEAADFGFREGFVTPIHGPEGALSAVLLIGSGVDPRDPDTRAAAHLLSIYYGTTALRLHRDGRRGEASVRLTRRQLECLKWVRHGKSSTDIGEILGLSARTVDHYLADACARLGVRTRSQAVLDAYVRGALQL